MKKITGLVIILAVLILGSYYGMGYLTEKKIKENLNVINQSNNLSVDIENYNRGWFRSLASLNWHLNVPEHAITNAAGQTQIIPAEHYELKMPITIHHGPLIFANKRVKFGLGYAHTELTLPSQFQEQFNNNFTSESTKPKLDLSILVSYLANTNIDLSVPEFKLISKLPNGQLEWLGLTSTTSVSSDKNKISGNLTAEGMRFTKEQIKGQVSTITSEYNLHRSEVGMYVGNSNLSFPLLEVSSNDKKIFVLKQFDAHLDNDINKGLLNSHFKASLEKMVVNDKTYGPGNIDLATRNFDADAWFKINDQMKQIRQSTNDLQRQQALLAILPELPQLLSKGAEFEISELDLILPEGKIEGTMLVSLPKTDVVNPFELLQKIKGNAKLRMPASVLKNVLTQSFQQKITAQPTQNTQQAITQQLQQQSGEQPAANTATASAPLPTTADSNQQATMLAEKQLAAMVQSGVLSVQGNDYVIEMSLNEGKLIVNGKPYDPAMLKIQ